MRVTRQSPCPVCQKSDWCLVKPATALCMRCQSNRPVKFKTGEEGWLHEKDNHTTYKPPPPKPVVTLDAAKLWNSWRSNKHSGLGAQLGVSDEALRRLGAVWAEQYRATAFPMRNGSGAMVGLRLRGTDGSKWAVRGSHQGIFIPDGLSVTGTILVTEGPTDAAAALDLGFYAIGRPSCRGGVPELVHWTAARRITRAVIIADNDGPGADGAAMLSRQLTIPSCTVVLPCKDLRDFKKLGGTKAVLDCMITSSVWTTR